MTTTVRSGFILHFTIAIVGVILFFLIFIYFFIAQPFEIKETSMEPNYRSGSIYLVTKLTPVDGWKRGDVVIVKKPGDDNYRFVKRIIGLPEESIQIRNGWVYINGHQLDEEYIPSDVSTLILQGSKIQEGETDDIPANYYFVLGDNRNQSSDSREWGSISEKDIIAAVGIKLY